MTRFRPFRNGDPPALVDLWNRGLPDRGVVRPLTVHEFDALVMGKLHFEAAGLIVAEREGRVLGYAHAGFGPEQPHGPSHRLDTQMGTVGMLITEPGLDDPDLERGLFLAAERYLRRRGAAVIYAGGQYPLNPFYWGLYGG
ncbi:MAG: GNAT family N-acetyltransferase, partial [Isosphaeraceae bacterium]|nr:GNAT family N-acetyltransferase [Isosphaeraceae bacterium]